MPLLTRPGQVNLILLVLCTWWCAACARSSQPAPVPGTRPSPGSVSPSPLTTTPPGHLVETPAPTLASTPRPVTIDVPALTPIAGWETYTSPEHGFSFMHPHLDASCCRVAGPASGDGQLALSLADRRTVSSDTDARFDGFSLYIVRNEGHLSLREYVEQEKAALREFRQISGQPPAQAETQDSLTLGGQVGIRIQGYAWDHVTRIYVSFPGGQAFLVIAESEKSPGSFTTFDQILSTFRF